MTKDKTAPEWDYLRKVTVRLIHPEERERFDGLLESQHYLHSARVGGPSVQLCCRSRGALGVVAGFQRGGAAH